MRLAGALGVAGVLIASGPGTAADYGRPVFHAPAPMVFSGIRPAPPLYYVAAPPQYVQDMRTGRPGRWVTLQPSFFDRVFGERNGY